MGGSNSIFPINKQVLSLLRNVTVPGCGGGAYGGLYPSQVGVNANMLPVSSDRNQGSDDQMTKKLWNSLTDMKIC